MNQRRWPRINVALSVQVRFQNRAEVATTRTLNISRSDLFIALARPRPIGTPVRINISIEDTGEQFALDGVVVHRQPAEDEPLAPGAASGVGVFLTSANPEYERFCDSSPAGSTIDRGFLGRAFLSTSNNSFRIYRQHGGRRSRSGRTHFPGTSDEDAQAGPPRRHAIPLIVASQPLPSLEQQLDFLTVDQLFAVEEVGWARR